MNLSVIIPAYLSRPEALESVLRCKESVLRTIGTHTEVLIQDDASPLYDGPALLGRLCQRNPQNVGFPANCNTVARRAQGDVLLFLNQDCWAVQPGWDAKLLDFFELEPAAGVAGPTLLFPDGTVQSVGGAFDHACQPFHVALGATNPDWVPINTSRKVSWVTGAAFAVRRSVWEALGGFDVVYGRGYFEDVDFCVRARLAGWDVWHRANIRLYHGVGSTGGNPQFGQNAQEFKRRWVDSGIVKAEDLHVHVQFWV